MTFNTLLAFVAKYDIIYFDFVAKYGTDDLFFRRLSTGKSLGSEATKTFMLPWVLYTVQILYTCTGTIHVQVV